MTLNTALKNWLALNAGTGTCFTGSNKSYNDADGVPHLGRTGDIVNAFYTAHAVTRDSAVIIAGTNYAALRVINGNLDIDLNDVSWCYANDGGAGATATYCTPVCVPVWACVVPLNGTSINSCDGSVRQDPLCAPPVCTPNWVCRNPLYVYEHDTNSCGGADRPNANCNPVAATNGVLNITSTPIRAYVIIDGVPTQKTTPAIFETAEGDHVIQLVMDGYQTLIQPVKIFRGQEIIKNYMLEAIAKPGGGGLSDLVIPVTILFGFLGLVKK